MAKKTVSKTSKKTQPPKAAPPKVEAPTAVPPKIEQPPKEAVFTVNLEPGPCCETPSRSEAVNAFRELLSLVRPSSSQTAGMSPVTYLREQQHHWERLAGKQTKKKKRANFLAFSIVCMKIAEVAERQGWVRTK